MIDLSVWRRRFQVFAHSGAVDRVDVMVFGGLLILAIGVAMQFTVAYALIVIGLALVLFGFLGLRSPQAPK